ncbi:MAG: hypothetical protein WKF88_07320 [Ferruginibacter sp.]
MIQPFEIFSEQYLARLIRLRKIYLVTQTYSRGKPFPGTVKTETILVTDYDDRGIAEIHYKAVREDKYAAVIDLAKEKHLATMHEMLSAGSKYTLYWSVANDPAKFKKIVSIKFKNNIRRYISAQTNWRIGADTVIQSQVECTFGELYINIKRGDQRLRVKFEEIEKA